MTFILPLAIILAPQAEIDAAVAKLYSVISGPAGQKRDWDAFRGIFAEGAQMRVIVTRDKKSRVVLLTPDDYVTRSGAAIEQNGFFEKEISRKQFVYGDMAQVWSTYEGRRKSEDEKPFARGINTITLAKLEGGWKILSISWTDEGSAGPLPAMFLPGG